MKNSKVLFMVLMLLASSAFAESNSAAFSLRTEILKVKGAFVERSSERGSATKLLLAIGLVVEGNSCLFTRPSFSASADGYELRIMATGPVPADYLDIDGCSADSVPVDLKAIVPLTLWKSDPWLDVKVPYGHRSTMIIRVARDAQGRITVALKY